MVRDNGGTIMNADVSLIAEAPRIGPHRQAMREALSDMLGISLERCSVKATTNETIGFVGRRRDCSNRHRHGRLQGQTAMSLFPADIEGLARQIIADFAADGLMVSTAESCTGGLIAGALTEISPRRWSTAVLSPIRTRPRWTCLALALKR